MSNQPSSASHLLPIVDRWGAGKVPDARLFGAPEGGPPRESKGSRGPARARLGAGTDRIPPRLRTWHGLTQTPVPVQTRHECGPLHKQDTPAMGGNHHPRADNNTEPSASQ